MQPHDNFHNILKKFHSNVKSHTSSSTQFCIDTLNGGLVPSDLLTQKAILLL